MPVSLPQKIRHLKIRDRIGNERERPEGFLLCRQGRPARCFRVFDIYFFMNDFKWIEMNQE